MTVDEKVGQMTQMTVTNFEEKQTRRFDMVKLKDAIHNYHRLDVKCSQSGSNDTKMERSNHK
jgi:hypothetical protein